MTQRNDILEVKQQSSLKARESPLSYEPRILRNTNVKRNLDKELSNVIEIKPKKMMKGKK